MNLQALFFIENHYTHEKNSHPIFNGFQNTRIFGDLDYFKTRIFSYPIYLATLLF